MTTTKPGRRPSDYKPKASVTAARQKAEQEAELARAEELRGLSEAEFRADTTPVDERYLRREQLITSGIGSKKTGAKLTLLTLLFFGLVVGSIFTFINNLVIPAVIFLGIAALVLLGLTLLIRNLYAALVNEFGKDATADILLSMAKVKREKDNAIRLNS